MAAFVVINLASSGPGTLIQLSQTTVSATDPPGSLDEMKDVWRQIEFPVNWDPSASNTLISKEMKTMIWHAAWLAYEQHLIQEPSDDKGFQVYEEPQKRAYA